MARMLDLGDILELVNNRLNKFTRRAEGKRGIGALESCISRLWLN